jgi:hypothetical protein
VLLASPDFGRIKVFVVAQVTQDAGPDSKRVFQLCDRGESALFQATVGELAELTLDKVDLRRAGRRQVQVPTGALGVSEPRRDQFGLGCRRIVEDNDDFQVLCNLPIDVFEEVEHLLRGVTGLRVTEQLTRRHVDVGEQVNGVVALAVVGHGGAAALLHRRWWPRAAEPLRLGRFIETEDHGTLEWVHVEAHQVAQLLFAAPVSPDLEGVGLPSLESFEIQAGNDPT